ncbi:MAG: hypothetical protein DRO23_10085 [Thermoprotei archaeon]|nr:MAG: hypothetical protein DRO23_10085 [Thermoprotei archaeon]
MIEQAGVVLYFTFMGLLGGFTWAFFRARRPNDLLKFYYVKRIVLGAIAGFLYYNIHTGYNLPNGIVAFVCGYFGTDFILAILRKYQWFKEGKKYGHSRV